MAFGLRPREPYLVEVTCRTLCKDLYVVCVEVSGDSLPAFVMCHSQPIELSSGRSRKVAQSDGNGLST